MPGVFDEHSVALPILEPLIGLGLLGARQSLPTRTRAV
jgi:hypothetical protein